VLSTASFATNAAIFMEDNGLRLKRKISIDHWQTNRSAISDEKGKSKILKKM